MARGVRGADRRTVLSGVLTCVFFSLYYVYVGQCLDPRLGYHADGIALPSGHCVSFPIFLQGTAFCRQFLSRPGGLAEYAAAFLSQYYYYAHVGPAILTAGAWLVYLLTDRLIAAGGAGAGRSLRFVPPLLLLIACNQYTFGLETCVALIAALIPAVLYLFVAGRTDNATVRLIVFAVISVPLYYAAGAAYMLFAVLCALFELLARRRYLLGGGYLLAGAVVPLVGTYALAIPFGDAYLRPLGVLPFDETVKATAVSALYVFFVLAGAALPFRRGLARRASAAVSRAGGLGRYCLNEKLKAAFAILILAAASASTALFTLDTDARRVLRANYLARMEMWGELLEQINPRSTQSYPASVMLDVNRALFETGRMGSEMFSYRQHPSVLFDLGAHCVTYKGGCDVLLRLGRVNEAEHAALEALEINGERPETLRQLAMIYIVKQQPRAARTFLNVLSRDIVHGRWATDCLRRLDDDPTLSSDREVQRLRSVMPLCDMLVTSTKTTHASPGAIDMKEVVLLALLARNPKNRMAFEYLMAYYMLAGKPGKVACSIDRLADFDYPAVPDHYAEAVLFYGYKVGRKINVPGRTIDKHADERVRKVIQILNDCRGDKEAAADALAAGFPNSFCRYLITGESGRAK